MKLYSISPDGTQYPLPTEEDYKREYIRVEKLVTDARKKGQEIVVVMGVGFVGAVMAAIVADTESNPPSTINHPPSPMTSRVSQASRRVSLKISTDKNLRKP